MLVIKRVYEKPLPTDGFRILVDRLWPRGVKKSDAKIDYWAKTITPTTELRKWFNHQSERFEQFAIAYDEQMQENPDWQAFYQLVATHLKTENVTLVFAAKSYQVNHALIILNRLNDQLKTKQS